MRQALDDAIYAVALHIQSGHRLRDFAPELRLLLAAARAFSCSECGGTGRVRVAVADWEGECRVCKPHRDAIGEDV